MTAPLLATILVVLFAGASLWADTLSPRRQSLPIIFLCGLVFPLFFELARYDHGWSDAYFAITWIGAPIVAILGGALWGSRKFYGYPDLGSVPSRAAAVAAVILLAVFIGVQAKQTDVKKSQAGAEELRTAWLAWVEAHDGKIPPTLETFAPDAPHSSMGFVSPPPFVYGRSTHFSVAIGFPYGDSQHAVLDLATGKWNHPREQSETRGLRPLPPETTK